MQIYKSPLDSSLCFGGKLGGSLEDYLFPQPILARKMLLDQNVMEQLSDINQYEIPPQELLGLLECHILDHHSEQECLISFLSQLNHNHLCYEN